MVIGNVKSTKIGLTKKFNKPRTIATIKAVENWSTITLSFIKYDINITNTEVIKILNNTFIVKIFHKIKKKLVKTQFFYKFANYKL